MDKLEAGMRFEEPEQDGQVLVLVSRHIVQVHNPFGGGIFYVPVWLVESTFEGAMELIICAESQLLSDLENGDLL